MVGGAYVNLTTIMNYKTRFKGLIRIDPKQRNWLNNQKPCKTMAGFLDIIINNYKKTWKNEKKKLCAKYVKKELHDPDNGPANTAKTD